MIKSYPLTVRALWIIGAVLALVSLLASCASPRDDVQSLPETPASSSTSRPNIILILADDIGVETVGAYGSEFSTPRIDSLADNGVRFDEAHATPVCTTSRTRLMVGTHNFKHYQAFAHLDPNLYTLSNYLKDAGYRTAVSGKWQLAGNHYDGLRGSYPEDLGFEEHMVWQLEWQTKGSRYWQPTLTKNGVTETHCASDFGPDLLNDFVLDFIDRNKDEPFFVYYTPVLAHDPWTTTPDSMDATTDHQKFAGMMEYLDKMVGRVLDKLEEHDLTDDTLIFFIGDNGTHPTITSLRNGEPITGGKWYTHRAGTHVPFLMQWRNRVPAGVEYTSLIDLLDVFPTIRAATDGDPDEVSEIADLDGVNLLSLVRNPEEKTRDWLFMHYDPQWGSDWFKAPMPSARFVFDEHWKLYGDGRFFNMQEDPLEKNDLAESAESETTRAKRLEFTEVLETIGDGPLKAPFQNPKATGRWIPDPKASCQVPDN